MAEQNIIVFCAFQIYKIKTTAWAPFSDVRKFGSEEELVKACDTAAQGQNATNATSFLIFQGLLVILILFGWIHVPQYQSATNIDLH